MPISKEEIFEKYAQIVGSLEYMFKSKQEIADELGVAKVTLYEWDKRLDWKEANIKRRALLGAVMHKIDAAMLRKAEKGDTKAAELFYTRFDGYIPVTGSVDLTKKDDDELKKRADEIKAQLLTGGIGPDMPGIGKA